MRRKPPMTVCYCPSELGAKAQVGPARATAGFGATPRHFRRQGRSLETVLQP